MVNVFECGKTPMLPASELAAMGFRLGIYPSQTHRAAIRAAQKVLRVLKEDGHTRRAEADLATFEEREAGRHRRLARLRSEVPAGRPLMTAGATPALHSTGTSCRGSLPVVNAPTILT